MMRPGESSLAFGSRMTGGRFEARHHERVGSRNSAHPVRNRALRTGSGELRAFPRPAAHRPKAERASSPKLLAGARPGRRAPQVA